MWLKNTDREVECFHPVCEEALNAALERMNLSARYKVQHHRCVGSIEMDLVVANKADNKILCVVEVKRTIAAVNSTRYQYQAMSYVQSLRESELESKYYVLTNLESSCLFKFDRNRPNVYEQIIEPGIVINHRFAEVPKEVFMNDLTEQYVGILTTIINDKGCYLLSFKQFADEIQDKMDTAIGWKKSLIGLFYEYIRGSFSKVGRTGLKTIAQLSNRADLICNEGSKINFKDIFTLPDLPINKRNLEINNNLLSQLFELGKTYVDADELANVMHKVISNGHEHEGEVPTDSELATIMLWLVKCVGGDIRKNEKLMDPAAGSGSLLCAASNVFDDIQPSQLVANDINGKLLQLLSLRIGLKFANKVGKTNTAKISTLNIADVPLSDFDDVKYIVMNPPFLSAVGVNCAQRKAELYRRIRQLKRGEPTTNVGQMPLEGAFVELVATLAKEGTVIAAILPNSHFTTKGDASVAIRKMLLEDFGLQLIFNYPQEKLFEGVAQNTSIVVGIKGCHLPNIRYLYSNEVVSLIDPTNVVSVLEQEFDSEEIASIDDYFEGRMLSRNDLEKSIESGWQIGNMSRQDAQNFVKANIATSPFLISLCESEYDKYLRGKVGNSGCTDLLYLKHNSPFLTIGENLLKGHLSVGLNNVKGDSIYIGDGDSCFFNVKGMTDRRIKKVVEAFIETDPSNNKKQRRNKKTADEYVEILKMESGHCSPAHCVMLPRMLRGNGRVFISDKPTFVSTNFFVIETDEVRSKLLASWFTTVFYQLECEAFGNNRKGLRKLEQGDYEPLHVPVTESFTDEQIQRIISTPIEEFLNLRSPKLRAVDSVWAEILFGENAEDYLEEAVSLIPILVADREK